LKRSILRSGKKFLQFIDSYLFPDWFYFKRLFNKYFDSYEYILIDILGDGIVKKLNSGNINVNISENGKGINNCSFQELVKWYLRILFNTIYQTRAKSGGYGGSVNERQYIKKLIDRIVKSKLIKINEENKERLVEIVIRNNWEEINRFVKVLNYVHSDIEIHSEQNCLLSVLNYGGISGSDLAETYLYVSTLPCIDCAKLIVSTKSILGLFYCDEYTQSIRPHIDNEFVKKFLVANGIIIKKI